MKGKINVKNLPRNVAIDLCLDEDEDEDEHENDLPPMPALDGDEEVKLQPEETVTERRKKELNPRKKNRNRIRSFNSKQTINQTSNIISTSKSYKQFIQIKKSNQANIVSFVST